MKLQVIVRRSKTDFLIGRVEGHYVYSNKMLDLKDVTWQASALVKKNNAKLINSIPYTPLLEYLENEFDHLNDSEAIEELEKRIKKFVSAKQVWVHHGRSIL